MDDKELVEVWQKEFESKYKVSELGTKYSETKQQYVFIDESEYKNQIKLCQILALNASYDGWITAKRSQPSVVLPRPKWSPILMVHFHSHSDISNSLTAAGIKYTIGE